MIPMIFRLRVKDKNNRKFGIWFPLFLIWLVILPLMALPAPLILLVSLLTWHKGKGRVILCSYMAIFSIIGNLSGLNLDINSKDANIYINLS